MAAIKLDGKDLSQKMEEELKGRVAHVIEQSKRQPVLATILVGEDPSSKIYVNMKTNACKRVGLGTRKVELSQDTSTEELLAAIDSLNQDEDVFGILLQHPVPDQIDERQCFNRISIEKDVDGVTAFGYGQMSFNEDVYVSATPGGIIKMLDHYNIPLEGKKAVVIGRSAILGKPIAMLLLNRNATVTICHSRTKNLPEVIKDADIVVAAIGKPDFIKAEWIKEGAVLIDAGYHKGGIGDVEKSAYEKAYAYTPVPGGVGPMTIATLIYQTVEAAEKKLIKN